MFERILVPLDGSITAEMALPYSVEIGARLASEIVLIGVPEPDAEMAEPLYRAYLECVTEQVKRRVESYGVARERKTRTEIIRGKPAAEVVSYAERMDASLITMASLGSSGRHPGILGNVADKVLRGTMRPVLLVRAPADEAAPQRARLIRKILVPMDGSSLGRAAVPFVEVLARALEAQIVLLHVLELRTTWGMYEGYPTYPAPESAEIRHVSAATKLEEVASPLRDNGLVVSPVVTWGLPARQIVDYSNANDIDLIAMSSHGRSGIEEWVFGSVTEKVLYSGNTPVLVVRPSGTR